MSTITFIALATLFALVLSDKLRDQAKANVKAFLTKVSKLNKYKITKKEES